MIEITSFARAYPSERRIYRIDRWTVPLPGGLPLAASAWFFSSACLVAALFQAPGLSSVAKAVGWPALLIVLPGALATGATRRLGDGRTLPQLITHAAAFTLASRSAGEAAEIPESAERVMVASSPSLPLSRFRICGPAELLTTGYELDTDRAGGPILVPGGTRPLRLALASTDRIEVRA